MASSEPVPLHCRHRDTNGEVSAKHGKMRNAEHQTAAGRDADQLAMDAFAALYRAEGSLSEELGSGPAAPEPKRS